MPEPKLVVARTIEQIFSGATWHCLCSEPDGTTSMYPLVAWVLTKDGAQPPNYKLEGAYAENIPGAVVQLCENHPGFQYYTIKK